MEIRVLEYFVVVAREKNISKAANILHVSQPTLSRQIMALEDEIGKKLLLRGNKNVELTEEGMLLYDRAQEIIDLTNHTLLDLRSDARNIKGKITIGTGGTDSFKEVAKMIKEFNRDYPLVTFHIYNGDMIDMEQGLDKGTIDFALYVSNRNMNQYHYLPLTSKERWGFLMKDTNPLASYSFIKLEDLKQQKIIFPERLLSLSSEENVLNKNDIQIVATFHLIESVLPLLEEEVGIIYCIEKELYHQLGYRFIPIEPAETTKPMLVWKKERALSLAMEKFISYAKYE